MREKVNSEIWGSPGSRQMLHLQQFPKILKNLRTLLYFDLVGFSTRFWPMIFWNVLQPFDLLSIDLFYSFNFYKSSLPLSSSSLLLHVFKVIFFHRELSHLFFLQLRRLPALFFTVSGGFLFFIGRIEFSLVQRCGQIFFPSVRRYGSCWALTLSYLPICALICLSVVY